MPPVLTMPTSLACFQNSRGDSARARQISDDDFGSNCSSPQLRLSVQVRVQVCEGCRRGRGCVQGQGRDMSSVERQNRDESKGVGRDRTGNV